MLSQIRKVKKIVAVPVGDGSNVNPDTLKKYLREVDFFLVSGSTKIEGVKDNPVSFDRTAKLVETRNRLLRH